MKVANRSFENATQLRHLGRTVTNQILTQDIDALRTCYLKIQITLANGDFTPTTLTCALFTLKINIKSPNRFYEIKLLGNTKAPSNA
jgi:hypothetical protein